VQNALTEQRPLAEIPAWNARLDALTPAMVRAAAQRYLDPKNLARFILLPEEPVTP
jgi:predicted Zn-dependent peptidase